MKKLFLLFVLTLFLTSCGNTETTEIPDDATVAECSQGGSFKYIYKDDVVYEFYSEDVLQENNLGVVQTAVDAVGTVREYLDAQFFAGSCTFTDYVPTD